MRLFSLPLLLLAVVTGSFAADEANVLGPNLLKNASFELPAVSEPTVNLKGGNPAHLEPDKSSWRKFLLLGKDVPNEGTIALGLTNQFSRTGKQSIFIDFQKLTTVRRRSYLLADPVPIKPGWAYRIGLWGRIDRKRPLTLDQRRPMLFTEMEFFTPDLDAQTGDLQQRTQMIPGYARRLTFVSNKWNEFSTTVRAPLDATWMKVTFRFESTAEKGTTDGIIYFDDASITEIPGSGPPIPIDPSTIAKPVEDEAEEKAEAEVKQ